jgi:porphobilinogen deaminase
VRRIRLGTRGSTLALAQSTWTKEQILLHQPALEVQLVVIKTGGNRVVLRKDELSQSAAPTIAFVTS